LRFTNLRNPPSKVGNQSWLINNIASRGGTIYILNQKVRIFFILPQESEIYINPHQERELFIFLNQNANHKVSSQKEDIEDCEFGLFLFVNDYMICSFFYHGRDKIPPLEEGDRVCVF
jgi:hypothetical protein